MCTSSEAISLKTGVVGVIEVLVQAKLCWSLYPVFYLLINMYLLLILRNS